MKPSTFSQELGEFIVERLWEGDTYPMIDSAWRALHPDTEARINNKRVHDWRQHHEDFDAACNAAMLGGCYALLDQGLAIVDNVDEDPASRRVRADWREKLVKRKRPDVFGDKVQLEHGGRLQVEALDDATLDARIAALMAKAAMKEGD